MKCVFISVLFIVLVCWIQSALFHWVERGANPSDYKHNAIRVVYLPQVDVSFQPILSTARSQQRSMFSKRHSTFATAKLEAFISGIAINNTVMTTVTDFGYLGHMLTFYAMSHLEQYPTFFVTALDQDAYRVGVSPMDNA